MMNEFIYFDDTLVNVGEIVAVELREHLDESVDGNGCLFKAQLIVRLKDGSDVGYKTTNRNIAVYNFDKIKRELLDRRVSG